MIRRCCFFFLFSMILRRTTSWLFQQSNRFGLKIGNPLKPQASVQRNYSKTQQEEKFQFYNYDGAKISYRKYNSMHQASTQQQSRTIALLLIHPIGIGQASWFWDRFICEWCKSSFTTESNYIIYTVDLLGCGVTSERNTLWNKHTQQYTSPEASNLPVSLPLMLWVEQCEAMLKQVICHDQSKNIESNLRRNQAVSNDRLHLLNKIMKIASLNQVQTESEFIFYDEVVVVAQGGLAPVAILLAARNPSLIKQMILTSPPTYKALTTSIPESELHFNMNALCNPFLERIAFGVLETKWAIQFFSNLFLFSRPCDKEWIDRTIAALGPAVRRPVQLFNSGYCFYRTFEDELLNMIIQPTLILSGISDNRDYKTYQAKLMNCSTIKINGKNVLPWESSIECCTAIKEFIDANDEENSKSLQ